MTITAGHKVLIFGAFRFDTRRQDLTQAGLPIRLSASQIRLLTLFLERPHELITREDITERLWNEPNSVDISSGINTAVNRLRSSLVDSSTKPAYIETVVGLGYRFVADIVEGNLSIPEEIVPSPDGPIPTPQKPRWWMAATSALLLLAIVGTNLWWHISSAKAPSGPPSVLKLNMVTLNDGDNKVTADAVSPDGQMTAYADSTGVLIHSLGSDTDQSVATPRGLVVHRIDWFTDGQRLAVSGVDSSSHAQVWVLSQVGEQPRLLLDDAEMAALSPDGKSIAFLRKEGHELWKSDGQGRAVRLLQAFKPANVCRFVLWTPNSKWLLTEELHTGPPPGSLQHRAGATLAELDNPWQWLTELIDPATGQTVDHADDDRFETAGFRKSGDLLYAEIPRHTADHALLLAQAVNFNQGRFDGKPRTLGAFNVYTATGLSASSDGSHIAVLITKGASVVKTAKLHFPGPELTDITQITHHSVESFPHAWTPNGDAVLLENNNAATAAIYTEAADGSRLTPIASLPDDAVMGQYTPDGRWILFLGFPITGGSPYGVFRVPATGGVPQRLNVPGDIREICCPLSNHGNCVLREFVGGKAIIFYNLDPLTGLGKELGRIPWQQTMLGDWSISPDGKQVAYANHDHQNPGIEISDFKTVREIPVSGFGTTIQATWSPDGTALFVECINLHGFSLVYQPLTGPTMLLHESQSPIWATVSRDGAKLAFPEGRVSTNLWIGTLDP